MYLDLLFVMLETYIYNLLHRHRQPVNRSMKYVLKLSRNEHRPLIYVYLKMVYSFLTVGASFNEYYNLDFFHRTLTKQKTFLTAGSNLRAYKVLNDSSYNHIFLNKNEFNTVFSDFIKRKWISLSDSKENVYDFFGSVNDAIVKLRNGDSGKGIFIVRDCKNISKEDIDRIIKENPNSIAEELLHNHPVINSLNSTSLNTMRIITVRLNDTVRILYAGIRFGSKGSYLDNISKGGFIAAIDISSGKICSEPNTKKTVVDINESDNKFYIGFQIPMWDELPSFLQELTGVVPQMKYMAWDIAITPNGFAVVEGNHNSGNTICQVHIPLNEDGLRKSLDRIISEAKHVKI